MTDENTLDKDEFIEKRRFLRIPFHLAVHYKTILQGKIISSFESVSVDLSAGGLGLRSEQRMQTGQILMLNLFLPAVCPANETSGLLATPVKETLPVSVLAKVVWCTQIGSSEYRFGVQFLELDMVSRKRLKGFLSQKSLNWNDCNLYR